MEMTGERRIEAPRDIVWQGLNDPEILRESIPGCESVDRTGPDSFQARVAVKLGPMGAKFSGKVQLTNINPPASYTIGGEGNGGAMGFAKGGADVALEEISPTETLLKYAVKAQVGGKMAQLGARLIDSTAKQMADQFFDRFAARVSETRPTHEAELPPGVEPTPAPGTEVGDAPAESRLAAATMVAAPRLADPVAGATGPLQPGTPTSDKPQAPARRPASAPASISLLSLIPGEIMGLPLTFWGGSFLWLILLVVLFLYG
ncbi:carbon monoxide dehydrogenase [Roseomonas aerophila]|uniref:Carbon monoxide dehydrogenase n=1 Tax=Teichococcus aerophilus TaxID=1224513 RepID=A0ABR7RHT3_9PROT|nr:carbon monoxide dehydrogenase subunit G [Pseudoroseomonas aerophila]MBC9205737.1 carbon monoxide dehydrogenase [Pseudoroseomonas aerophila]